MPTGSRDATAGPVRFLVRYVPPVSIVVALGFLAAAIAIGYFGVGNYASSAESTDAGMLLLLFAVVAFAIGRWTPRIVRRFLPDE